MTSTIYRVEDGGELTELNEAPYDSEAALQGLLKRYPALLAGEQIDSENPRRWLLVAREAQLKFDAATRASWFVDHVFLDQSGIPTIIEVKRSSDTRIRREVVGQMLDYAANAVVYWEAERLRSLFQARCSADGIDPEDELSNLLDEEDADSFWSAVKTNLQAGRVRLVFVADEIPRELRRIVEFLNAQMDPAEVLALEVKQYRGEGTRTLVPRVVGHTAQAEQKKGARNGPAAPRVSELSGTTISVAPGVTANPRRPNTHGWLAFEILLQAGGRMEFDEYQARLFDPSQEVTALAKHIPGKKNGYQRLDHIRHDIKLGRVIVEGGEPSDEN